jgi:hypothetical protein
VVEVVPVLVALLRLPLEEELPLLLMPRRKRRRKRRSVLRHSVFWSGELMEGLQEESDDDMGFGLFD